MTATLGIDLSSQPKNTALCAIAWRRRTAEVIALYRGADHAGTPLHDRLLVSAMRGLWGDLPPPAKVAIDAPLGWPVDFTRGLAHPDRWPVHIDSSRARLERRATDHWVHRTTGKQPLSVTTDRIGYAAMRAAGIISHYTETEGRKIDRTGLSGLVCEAYPDPAIRSLGLWPRSVASRQSYKGTARHVRDAIVGELAAAAPWLTWTEHERQCCIDSDDCLDALICAIVARAADRNETVEPPNDLVANARVEGWIHLPRQGALARLL